MFYPNYEKACFFKKWDSLKESFSYWWNEWVTFAHWLKIAFLGKLRCCWETTVVFFFFWLCSDISLRQESRKESKETNKNIPESRKMMSPDFSIKYTTERNISSDICNLVNLCFLNWDSIQFNILITTR